MKKMAIVALAAAALAFQGCKPSEGSMYSWDKDLAERLAIDFCEDADGIKSYIQKYTPDVTDEQIAQWTQSGQLEAMEIDGELKYFELAAPNLFRTDPASKAIKDAGNGEWELPDFEYDAAPNYVAIANQVKGDAARIAEPKRMRVKYSITVDPDVVPAGKTIRCWMPFPRTDVERQKDVKLLSTSDKNFTMSDPSCAHSTLYMEATAVAGQPTVFEEEFEYTSYGEWHPELTTMVKPYDTSSPLYKQYTAEQPPHIVFTDEMKALSNSICEGLDSPLDKAKAIFTWINDNFPWASAREYSTIPNIPEYVLNIGHGDCGQVTLLFMTLARIQGIPVHWQSGFTMVPGDDNLHDWNEIYFEGVGWVPMDMSRGISENLVRTFPLTTMEGRVLPSKYDPEHKFKSADEKALNETLLWFYVGGIDSYRMIVNKDWGQPLSPAKTFPRSETVDFQRGELEWEGGNLYFDKWHRHMEVEYL